MPVSGLLLSIELALSVTIPRFLSSRPVTKAKCISVCADTALCFEDSAKLLTYDQPMPWHALFSGIENTAAFGDHTSLWTVDAEVVIHTHFEVPFHEVTCISMIFLEGLVFHHLSGERAGMS